MSHSPRYFLAAALAAVAITLQGCFNPSDYEAAVKVACDTGFHHAIDAFENVAYKGIEFSCASLENVTTKIAGDLLKQGENTCFETAMNALKTQIDTHEANFKKQCFDNLLKVTNGSLAFIHSKILDFTKHHEIGTPEEISKVVKEAYDTGKKKIEAAKKELRAEDRKEKREKRRKENQEKWKKERKERKEKKEKDAAKEEDEAEDTTTTTTTEAEDTTTTTTEDEDEEDEATTTTTAKDEVVQDWELKPKGLSADFGHGTSHAFVALTATAAISAFGALAAVVALRRRRPWHDIEAPEASHLVELE